MSFFLWIIWYQPRSAFVSCTLLNVSLNPVTEYTWSRPPEPVHVHVHVHVQVQLQVQVQVQVKVKVKVHRQVQVQVPYLDGPGVMVDG